MEPFIMLHEILSKHRSELLARWNELVKGTIAPDRISRAELTDHMPEVIEGLIIALRMPLDPSSDLVAAALRGPAEKHGIQRLRLGFSLDAVVREYGALRNAMVETAEAAGYMPTIGELNHVFDCVINGIADAVAEYAQQRNAEASRQHNEHVAFIAHELRNPLTSAMTALELLRFKQQLPPESRATAALGRALRSMHEVVDHSLRMASLASGLQLHREPVRVRELCEEAAALAEVEAESKGVTFHLTIVADAVLLVDRRLIRSALGNLFHNAVKYTPSGKDVDVRARLDDQHAIVEVEDSCGGIDPVLLERAFAPFVRLTTSEPGFGLGLSIAKQAVEAHGGQLYVENREGKGCVFVVDLPRTADVR
ncbi:MAG: ATP-binding protein [Kofleriaceae bacterium]